MFCAKEMSRTTKRKKKRFCTKIPWSSAQLQEKRHFLRICFSALRVYGFLSQPRNHQWIEIQLKRPLDCLSWTRHRKNETLQLRLEKFDYRATNINSSFNFCSLQLYGNFLFKVHLLHGTKASWAFKWFYSGPVGKTADLTVVQKTIIAPLAFLNARAHW